MSFEVFEMWIDFCGGILIKLVFAFVGYERV